MNRTRIIPLLVFGLMFSVMGCHSHHEETKTRKVTVEGPERKTELKVETTKKEKNHD